MINKWKLYYSNELSETELLMKLLIQFRKMAVLARGTASSYPIFAVYYTNHFRRRLFYQYSTSIILTIFDVNCSTVYRRLHISLCKATSLSWRCLCVDCVIIINNTNACILLYQRSTSHTNIIRIIYVSMPAGSPPVGAC